jgi:type VI secretion system protein ImpA
MPIDIETLLQPVSVDGPCGPDLRDHPLYIQIREVRRQEDTLNQGVWKRDLKEADYPLALKLSAEALTKLGKDLQVAAWMTEALVHLEGFAGLRQGLELLQKLLETYWDSIHPLPDEDGDLDFRATPLRWVGSQVNSAIRSVALTKGGHNWYQYRESLAIPGEDAARNDSVKLAARDEAIRAGQIPPEEFANGLAVTPVGFSKQVYDALLALSEQVHALNEFCDGKFGDAAPEFSDLRKTLEEVTQTARVLFKQKGGVEKAAQAPAPAPIPYDSGEQGARAPAPPAVPAYAAPLPAAPPESHSSGLSEPASHDDAVARLLAAARYLRKENPYDPTGYLIPRTLRWGELRAAGGYNPSLLAAPPADLRTSLKRLSAEGYWDQVGELAEDAAGEPCGRAWLDLQRYAAYSAQSAGANAVLDAILAGVKALLADIPQLVQWTLTDDTPVANPETMAWLRERSVLPGTSAPRLQAAPKANSDDGAAASDNDANLATPDPYQLAMQAAQSGNIEEALDILSREMAQEPCGRDRFLRKLQVAQLCLATGNQAIGEPVLMELAEEIDRRKLAEWELADTIVQPLTLLYRCLDGGEDSASEKQNLYARICRLSPARAVGLAR